MKLAVLFPGMGYHNDKPLLYYAKKLIHEMGECEIVSLSYNYSGGSIRGDEDKMKEAFYCLYEQAEEQLNLIDFSIYKEIIFISKSIGTIISSAYADRYDIPCRQILYTPLMQTFQYPHKDAISFIGTADPWSDVSLVVRAAKEQSVSIYEYEGANHSIEDKDTMHNLEMLQDVMMKTKEFLKKSSQARSICEL